MYALIALRNLRQGGKRTWLLGLALAAYWTEGRMWATLLTATLFATLRHIKRTGLDVRRFHAQ